MGEGLDSCWACLVDSQKAKPIKDALQLHGWLDKSLRPASLPGADGVRVAFPLLSQSFAACAAAVAAGEPAPFGTAEAVEQLSVRVFKPKPPAKPQRPARAPAAPRRVNGPRKSPSTQERSFGGGLRDGCGVWLLPAAAAVRQLDCPPDADWHWLREHALASRQPVVLRKLDLGACGRGKWTADHLAQTRCTAERVSVHVTASSTVDLAGHRAPGTPRNFVFRAMAFAEAVARCSQSARQSQRPSERDAGSAREAEGVAEEGRNDPPGSGCLPPLLGAGERYYLRSVGIDPRRDAADFPKLFPELARECRFFERMPTPKLTERELTERELTDGQNDKDKGDQVTGSLIDWARYHSSVLRLASDDTQLWTHFDVMDNLLAQLTGQKRVVLWPPTADADLYVEGSSSRVSDIDRWNDDSFPRFRRAVDSRLECSLEPGDVLFIPALWFHNVTSRGFSVALNLFWRSHHGDATSASTALYDRKDLYGNRDPPAATRAAELVEAAVAELASLPDPFRSFYSSRAARRLEEIKGDLEEINARALNLQVGDSELNEGDDETNRNGNGPQSRPQSRPQSCPQSRPQSRPQSGPAADATGSVLLSSGARMPALGLGTYLTPPALVGGAVRGALRAGVRHFDCASVYRNQREVGIALHEALCEGHLRRADLFVTSKLWNDAHADVRAACVRTLRELGLERLDLYLVHWPIASGAAAGTTLEDTWRQMEALVVEGLVTSIGVSNWSSEKLGALVRSPTLCIPPAVNQIEAHPRFRNEELLSFCSAHGVHVTAYAPLGSGALGNGGSLLHEAAVIDVAARIGCTPAQALLRWAFSRGCSAIFKSVESTRIAENFEAALGTRSVPHEALATLSGLEAQARRHTGAALIRGTRAQYESLAQLWDDASK